MGKISDPQLLGGSHVYCGLRQFRQFLVSLSLLFKRQAEKLRAFFVT
jgi:hypothetical protein